MALKPRYKRRIFWSVVATIGILAVGIVVIPPLITINGIKPRIQQTIAEQTGVNVKIQGDVNFSLLGRATIVAHDLILPAGRVGSVMFSIPLRDIFNLKNAKLADDVVVYDANVTIDNLIPQNFKHSIELNNSVINFKNKDYKVVRAVLQNGRLDGTVRTADHKYDITFDRDTFFIRNQNNKLEISGHLFADGSARGVLAIETDNINRWFEFSVPQINKTINMTMNFVWDGDYGFDFTNISANDFSGDITLKPNGAKKFKLRSNNMDFDFSFLSEPSNLFLNTDYDLDFYGNLKFNDLVFNHFKLIANGDSKELNIKDLVADDIHIYGGYIDETGAHNVMIEAPYDGIDLKCLFSGTPNNWKCSKFTYGILSGSLSVVGDEFDIYVQSERQMPGQNKLAEKAIKLGKRGKINFNFSNMGGTLNVEPKQNTPSYTFAKNKPLNWAGNNLAFIPAHMQTENGDFDWRNGKMEFVPYSNQWMLVVDKNNFFISGKNIKDWFPNVDLQALNDLSYEISGTQTGDTISNLLIKIGNQQFTGTATKNAITLKTDVLNLDSFISKNFIDNYAELEFLTGAPIMIPFTFDIGLSLSADHVIYNGDKYKNFVYSLKQNSQTFSITDTNRGNLLATIAKKNNQYNISAQLNQFVIGGSLLSAVMPINIRDTSITGEVNMSTWGHIAHDLEYNLVGNLDISFTGGFIDGIGIDAFYANTANIKTLNAEYAFANALESGTSQLKKMHIIGEYKNGNFKTTAPFDLQLRHTDAMGNLNITDGQMMVTLQMIMRGTSPQPSTINLQIFPDNSRGYSLSEIMNGFDPTYMRDFVKTHNRF